MDWSELHSKLLANAFEKVLGQPDQGAMAFVRCLTPDVVEALARDSAFAPRSWQVRRVAAVSDQNARTITADHAVELREAKGQPTLLLVDTDRAGAGMDGIYSAACEVSEASLLKEALSLTGRELTRRLSSETRKLAEQAVKKARGFGQRFSLSPWTEFDFLVRVATTQRYPAEL